MPDWLPWLIAAAVLLGVEMLSLDLIFVMLAGGAVGGAVAAALGAPLALCAVVFAVVAVALLAGVRPIAKRHLSASLPHTRTGVAKLEGAKALVLEEVDEHHGQVKIGGETWTARAYDPTQHLESGAEVQVMQIEGATALVWRQ